MTSPLPDDRDDRTHQPLPSPTFWGRSEPLIADHLCPHVRIRPFTVGFTPRNVPWGRRPLKPMSDADDIALVDVARDLRIPFLCHEVSLVLKRQVRKSAFSLIELVIVVAIAGLLAAIALPRMSAGARGAGSAAVLADLSSLRRAIELYAIDHDGNYPNLIKFMNQLTRFTDIDGKDRKTPGDPYIFGPYLRMIPVLPVGEGNKNGKGRRKVGDQIKANTAWVYDENTGAILANTGTATDANGNLISDY
jgi:general secretion pathway protein G